MAAIKENKKGRKIVSFKFRACVGRDEKGKQVFKCKTWYPAEGLTNAQSRKAAATAAEEWEKEVKSTPVPTEETKAVAEPETEKTLTFSRFVQEVWLPLAVDDGEHSPSTVAMYKHILNVILPRLGRLPIHEITGLQITAYLKWLRTEYRTKSGDPLSDKTVRHHFNILRIAFNFAERQDLISQNPIRKVNPPRVMKKRPQG